MVVLNERAGNASFLILRLVERLEKEAPIVPQLSEIDSLVRQDLKRRRGDEALRSYIDDLRARTPIQIDESVFVAEADPG